MPTAAARTRTIWNLQKLAGLYRYGLTIYKGGVKGRCIAKAAVPLLLIFCFLWFFHFFLLFSGFFWGRLAC